MRKDLTNIEDTLNTIKDIGIDTYLSKNQVDNLMYLLENLKDSIYVKLKIEEMFLLKNSKQKI